MKKTVCQALCAIAVMVMLTACAPDENPKTEEPMPVLPPPQVWITSMPATSTATPELTIAVESTPTVSIAEPIQPWPTVDEEQYLLDEIDGLISKIDKILRSTDTNIKP